MALTLPDVVKGHQSGRESSVASSTPDVHRPNPTMIGQYWLQAHFRPSDGTGTIPGPQRQRHTVDVFIRANAGGSKCLRRRSLAPPAECFIGDDELPAIIPPPFNNREGDAFQRRDSRRHHRHRADAGRGNAHTFGRDDSRRQDGRRSGVTVGVLQALGRSNAGRSDSQRRANP